MPFPYAVRELSPTELLPWPLLLLADPSAETVRGYVAHSRIWVAVAAETVVGVCVVELQTDTRAEIRNLAVAAEWQGSGLGKELLRFAAEQAQQQGLRTLRVCTGNSSLGPLALYQKMGFDLVDLQRHFFTRHYPEPIWENGILCRHRLVLEKELFA
jgi:aminoglycoside 6'-N-acetyltransferase I